MPRSRPKASPSKPRIPTHRQKHIDRLVERFRAELEERFSVSDEIMTIGEIEAAACDIRDDVGQAVAEEITQAEADAAEEKEKQMSKRESCQKCSRGRPFRGTQERTIVTIAGDVHVRRKVYHCRRCKHCTMPVDHRLGLPEHRFTPKVEQWVARLCVNEPYEHAVALLSELSGVWVSAKEAQRIAQEMGKYAQEVMQDDVGRVLPWDSKCAHLRGKRPEALAPQWHDPNLTAYISMDGVMVPRSKRRASEQRRETNTQSALTDKSPTEAKLGHIELIQEMPGGKEKTLHSLYSFHLGGPDECAEQTYALACRAGITELSRLVFVADGAEWIWRRAKQYYPYATQILDWYHAMEHLGCVVKSCVADAMAHPEGSKRSHTRESQTREIDEQQLSAECDRRINPLEELMRQGKVEELLAEIATLPQTTAQAKAKVRETIGYFSGHAQRMRYNEYRAKGFRIGSGAMESGCKQVVTARLKRAGMRWSEVGAQAIGHLRALYLSTNRWSEVIGNWKGRGLTAVPSC